VLRLSNLSNVLSAYCAYPQYLMMSPSCVYPSYLRWYFYWAKR